MDVIRIAPLAALPTTVPQVLDYFWSDPLPQGSIVQVMIGRRPVMAVVLESLDLVQAKMAIKKADFGLKKITSVVTATPQITVGQLALARWMSRQYYAPLGLCLKTILPSWIGKRGKIIELPPIVPIKIPELPIEYILTQPDTALKEIQKRFHDAPGQVLVIVPEITLAKHLAHALEDLSPLVVHSNMKIREHTDVYGAVLRGSARIVIGTRLALFLPWQSLSTVIVEDPLHEAYKSDMTPRYAGADAARELARLGNASLTYLSPALSTANHYLINKKVFSFADHKAYWPTVTMIDMVQEQERGTKSILSRHTQEVLMAAHDTHQRVLVFSPRRAYTSMLACQRCHTAVSCATCSIPMRVHEHSTERMLVCYHCAAYTPVPTQCPTCHTGPLKPAGLAGSQKIVQAINDCFDRHGLAKIPIPVLDSDLVRSDSDEQEIFRQLDAGDHHILVATQMIFSHRYARQFDHVIVIGADALSYNPDFRTQERLVYQLEKMADFAPKHLTIQYWDDHGALQQAPKRSWSDFYTQELADRKSLGWPPFNRLVKLTFAHRERATSGRMAAVAADRLRRATSHMNASAAVKVFGPTPALVERAGGRWSQHLILKTTLPADRLTELLMHVPAGALIDVDPRSIT